LLLVKVAILTLLHPQQVTVNQTTIARRGAQIESAGKLHDRLLFRGALTITTTNLRRTYRGDLEVTSKNNELQLLLTATEDDLVAATVSAESPPNAPPSALAAQAILSRSWIRVSRGRHGAYDLCDTTHCQHFKEPTPAGIAAARATAGLVLAWQGKPFAPAFSASCGGRTKTASAIGWSDDNRYPYFAVDCAICRRDEPQWTRRFEDYDASTLREHPHSEHVRLSIGRRSGWAALPSNNYELVETNDGLELRGRGQGHGLGYCQRGGAGMAKQGKSFQELLRHYFPGTAIIGSR